MFLAEVMSTSQEVAVFPATPTVQNAQGQQPTVLPALVPLSLTPTLASAQVPSTSQEVAVIPAIQGATAAQTLETLTAVLAGSKETPQMFVVHQEKTTFLELGVFQPVLLASIETHQETAKIVIQVVVDVQKGQTQTVTLVTPETTSKTMVQETVCASLGTTETGQCALNVTTLAKNARDRRPTALTVLIP